MKKKFALILAIIMTLSIPLSGQTFAKTTQPRTSEPAEKDPRGSLMAGEIIKCSSVSPTAANVVINNSGMSGLDSYIHLHNTIESNSYKTNYSGKRGAFTFTFKNIEALGYMYIWNYNGGTKQNDGMKDVKIQYSVDNKNWFNLNEGNFQLAKALSSENLQYGGNASNNLNDGNRTPVNFGGLPVRYVRIIPQTNYGGTGYGLSEVRFFKFKTRPDTGSLISSSARAPLANTNASNLTNNYGLSDLTSSLATHTNNKDSMWSTSSAKEKAFVVINLDGTYPVDKMYIWNYNNNDALNNGMKDVKIEYTTKNPYSTTDTEINYTGKNQFGLDEWISLGNYVVPQGTGADNMPSSLSVDFGGKQIQNIRITPISNYGGTEFGLSAVRVFAKNGWAVEPSRDWGQLFSNEGSFDYQTSGVNKKDKIGWLLADGIYTLNTNGKDMPGSSNENTKSVFLFSDTLIGNLDNFSGTYGQYGKKIKNRDMKNNTLATLIGNRPDPRNIQFYITPSDSSQSILGNGNWAQELLKIGNKMYCWSFAHDNSWSATNYMFNTFDLTASGLPSFTTRPKYQEYDGITKFTENDVEYKIEFSAAVLDNTESGGATPESDGFIYIYGIKSHQEPFFSGFRPIKLPVVARVTPDKFTDTTSWRYWNGTDWVNDVKQSATIDTNKGTVSSEFSVTYMDSGTFAGKYVLTCAKDLSTQVSIATSDKPYGPFVSFTEKQSIYNAPDMINIRETNNDNNIYVYNAKAHPHLSAKGELLISYNLNSYNFDTQSSFEYLHPQFITLFDIKENGSTAQQYVTNMDENLAKGATATASSTKSAEQSASMAIDGNVTTSWSSNVAVSTGNYTVPDTNLTLDFGKLTKSNQLIVNWSYGQAKKALDGYIIQYSDDGQNWSEAGAMYQYGSVKTITGVSCYADTIKYDEINARYLRVKISKAAGTTAPGIREIEVYSANTQAVPKTDVFTPTPNAVGAVGEIDADYSGLQTEILRIQALNLKQTLYTPDSWANFQTAFDNAKAVWDTQNSSDQTQIDSLLSTLKQSFGSLVLINYSALQTEIARIQALNLKSSLYKADSWAKFQTAFNNAKALNNAKNATSQSQVDNMLTTLKNSYKSLVKKKNGWVKVNLTEYYYKNDVLLKNQWINGSKTYRTDSKGAKIKGTKWLTIKNKKYRLVKDVLQKNFILKISNKYYYVDKNGVLKKNAWIHYKKNWYRANASGKLYTSKVTIKGKTYYFKKNGICKNKK